MAEMSVFGSEGVSKCQLQWRVLQAEESRSAAKRARLQEPDQQEEGEGSSEEGEEEEEGEDGEGEEGDEGMEEQMKEFFSELDLDFARQKRKLLSEGLRAPRRKSVLPAHLHSVMGSANLRLARGDAPGAIELCLEVIRQAPHSPEPYLTLATLYEETGDREKLLQILAITAHLKRVDVGLWSKTGQLASDLGNLSLAVKCYHQACKLEPGNVSHIWCKAILYQRMDKPHRALETFEQLLKSLPPTSGHDIVEVSKEIAQLYHSSGDTPRAVDLLHQAIHQHMSVVSDEAAHLLVELQISSKLYHDAYELITTFYNMVPDQSAASTTMETTSHDQSHDQPATPTEEEGPTFQQMLSSAIRVSLSEGETVGIGPEEMEEGGGGGGGGRREEEGNITQSHHFPLVPFDLVIPDDLLVDMRVKLALCLIHLSFPLPPSLLPPVLANPEEYGDLFLDLAEAYSENGAHSKALPLLSALVHTERYNQAGVWLKYAECLHILHDLEGAAMSYSRVLLLAPHHTNTRLALATIYVQLGQVDDALALLESEHCTTGVPVGVGEEGREEMERGLRTEQLVPKEYSLEDLRLLLHKYTVLVDSGRLREYVEDGAELLAALFRDVYYQKDIRNILHLSLKVLRERLKESSVWKGPNVADGLMPVQDWWNVFLVTCKGLLTMGPAHHKRLLHLVGCAAALGKFDTPDTELPFSLFASSLCYSLHDYSLVLTLVKRACIKLNQPALWNILNILPYNYKLQKYILRLCFKHPTTLPLLHIHANYSLVTSNYKFALCLLEQIYRQRPSDYLLCLSIGTVYFNMAAQSKATCRNALVLQGMGFFHKYLRLRGKCQESMYNLGRAFHQLGIVHVACHFYRQALILEPENNSTKWRHASDLRPEAAFNLSLIYRASGNSPLALHTLSQYCRV